MLIVFIQLVSDNELYCIVSDHWRIELSNLLSVST